MPARTVVQRLIATARPLGKGRWNDQTGYGAIQITAAMNPSRYPVATDAPNPVYASFDKWRASLHGSAPNVTPTPSDPASAQAHAQNRHKVLTLPVVLGGVIVLGPWCLPSSWARDAVACPGTLWRDSGGEPTSTGKTVRATFTFFDTQVSPKARSTPENKPR
jgi:hypothetical protein